MKEYLVSVIWVSIIVAVADILAPSLDGIKKYLKLIGSLCVVCVVMMPLIGLCDGTDDVLSNIKESITNDMEKDEVKEKYQNRLNEYLNSYSENEFKEKIYELIGTEFEIPRDDVEIKLFVIRGDDNVKVEKMQIILSGRSIFKNPYHIEEYFSKLISCECEVLI